MTEPTKHIDGIRQQGCPIDGDSTLVSVIGYDLMSAALWIVERDGAAHRIGGTPAGCPKIDSAFPRAFPDGTARLCMAQADVGGGGATSHLTWIDFPGAFTPPSAATCVDQAARNQANAATNMAHSAINQNTVQDQQIAELAAAVEGL